MWSGYHLSSVPHPNQHCTLDDAPETVFLSETKENARLLAENTDALKWAVPPEHGGNILVLADFGYAIMPG